MRTASAILLNVGAISALWGILWFAWDHRAQPPGYLLVVALTCLLAGALI